MQEELQLGTEDEAVDYKREVCRYFMENKCTFDPCKFSHDLKSFPCKHFNVVGRCTHGCGCR